MNDDMTVSEVLEIIASRITDPNGYGMISRDILLSVAQDAKSAEERLAEFENDDVRVRRERSFRASQLMQIKLIGMDAAGLPDATALTVFHEMGLAIDEAIGA